MPAVLSPVMGSLFKALNAKRRLLLGVLCSLRHGGVDAAADGAVARLPVTLGRSTVHLVLTGAAEAGVVFVNLHENERTSVQAAHLLRCERPAPDSRMLVLRAQGRRHIVFWIGLQPFMFDPNRIFSDCGIEATLRFHGAWSSVAQAAVAGLRKAIVGQLETRRTALIIALHNNGIGPYSIDSYRPGSTHAGDAAAVHTDAQADAGNFFLVNQEPAFDALRGSGFGVVLQRADRHDNAHDHHHTDDGSMSRYFTAARPLYVNVEARHGHLREQVCMLAALMAVAPRLIAGATQRTFD